MLKYHNYLSQLARINWTEHLKSVSQSSQQHKRHNNKEMYLVLQITKLQKCTKVELTKQQSNGLRVISKDKMWCRCFFILVLIAQEVVVNHHFLEHIVVQEDGILYHWSQSSAASLAFFLRLHVQYKTRYFISNIIY